MKAVVRSIGGLALFALLFASGWRPRSSGRSASLSRRRSTSSSCCSTRITSYNVCYTKLLRIAVEPTSGLVTSEDGTTDTFTVVLDAQPTGDVSVEVSTSNLNEGLAGHSEGWDRGRSGWCGLMVAGAQAEQA